MTNTTHHTGNLRQVRRDPRGAYVPFRGGRYAAPALDLLPPRQSVYVLRKSPFEAAVWLPTQRTGERPLCIATFRPAPKHTDAAQMRLGV